MSESTTHIINTLAHRIEEVRSRYYREQIVRGILVSILFVLLLFSIFLLSETLFLFSAAVRTVLFFIFIGVSLLTVLWNAGIPAARKFHLLTGISEREINAIIGRHFPEVHDQLQNIMDLGKIYGKEERYSVSKEFIEVAVERFSESASALHFTEVVSFKPATILFRQGAVLFLALVIGMLVPNSPLANASYRVFHFMQEFHPPLPFMLQVFPGNKEIVKGESAEISVRIVPLTSAAGQKKLPSEVFLYYREEGIEKNEKIKLQKDSSGIFRYHFTSLNSSLRYSASAEDVQSNEYQLAVTERPFVRTLSVTVTPPKYSRLAPQTLDENTGDVSALAGSRIIWNILPSKEISSAAIVFKDGSETALKKNGTHLQASFTADSPTSYYIELEDAQGLMNSNLIEYKITILPDAEPSVSILFPGKNIDVTDNSSLPLQIKIEDDFGFSGLALFYKLVQSKYSQEEKEQRLEIPLQDKTSLQQIISYEWNLSSLHLAPEDIVEYYAAVYDNDNVNGPKAGKSASYLLRLPSLEEVFADAEKSHDNSLKTLEESLKAAEDLKKDLEELHRDMKRNKQLDWQKQKKAEEIAKKYDDIQKKIDEVNKTVNEMTEQLNKNNTLSSETLEKYLELQKTLQEMNTPEFREAMKRMQQAMQQMNSEQLRQAMEQAQFSEEQFRSSIERTLNLLKRIQIEQKVDEMKKRAEELMKKQEELQKETKNLKENDAQKGNDLARKQEDISKELNNVQEEMKSLREKMEEFPKEMPMDQLQKTEEAAENKSMEQSMKQSSQQLRSTQPQQAMQSQQQSMQGLQQMANEMSALQEQLLSNQMQETMSGLQKAMKDLLRLSQKEEQLKNQTQQLDYSSQQFKDIAVQQQNIHGDLANIANQLMELSQKSFAVSPEMGKQIGKAMGTMQQSMQGIESRNGNYASSFQGEAMASLNKAAALMQGAMQQMQQQGGQGGGSLLQQLRNMAQQQMQINMQTQQMGNQEGMTQQQLQEMGRLAKQQDAVRKSMEQLQREAEQSRNKENVLGDLKKISDEMKEVVEKLEQNNIDANTVRQQERILSRMLQAQNSVRERDFEQKRKALSGTTPARKSPAELEQSEKGNDRSYDLQRAVEAGYSKDYLEYIRKYYEALQKTNSVKE